MTEEILNVLIPCLLAQPAASNDESQPMNPRQKGAGWSQHTGEERSLLSTSKVQSSRVKSVSLICKKKVASEMRQVPTKSQDD
jgi:hypothetical protein